jgi:hypothetical protein
MDVTTTTTAREQTEKFRLASMAAGQDVDLSVEEATTLCGISRTKLYGEIAAKRTAVRERGRQALVLPTDVKAWLRGETTGTR